jgi:hypothetical protein
MNTNTGPIIIIRPVVTLSRLLINNIRSLITYIYIGLNGKFLRFRRDGVSKPRSFYKAGI